MFFITSIKSLEVKDDDLCRQVNAEIRKTFGINPDHLNEEEWCKLYADALWLKKIEYSNMTMAMEVAVLNALSKILGNVSNNDAMDS